MRKKAHQHLIFQSTLPARGATRHRLELLRPHDDFNPRSPHGERLIRWTRRKMVENFNPRSPHGERPKRLEALEGRKKFQSTLPARGATASIAGTRTAKRFQSTLPARGATLYELGMLSPTQFQSTLPARGATVKCQDALIIAAPISIHAPRTGSDPCERSP